jgi:integrase
MTRSLTTQAQILAAAPGRHHVDRCLFLQVSVDGRSRRYIFRYQSPVTGRPNEKSLGNAYDIPPNDARKRAAKLRVLIAEGTDPVLADKQKRAQDQLEAMTFSKLLDQYAVAFASRSVTADMCDSVRRHCGPLLSATVANVDTPAIARALAPLQAAYPKQARRVLAAVTRLLDFARVKGWRGDRVNPAAWRGNFEHLWPPVANGNHHPAMPYGEVPAFIGRLLQDPSVTKLAIAFTILTGARSGEVLGATKAEVLGDVWSLSATRTKQRREHKRPLSAAALDVIERAAELSGPSDYLFPASHGGKQSARAMERCLHGTLGATCSMHGFRSSLRDFLGNETATDFHTCEEVLGHSIGNATVVAYRREASLTKMRAALNLWADFLLDIPTENVVPFAAAR